MLASRPREYRVTGGATEGRGPAVAAALAAGAAVLLAWALGISAGLLVPTALGMVTVATALALAAAWLAPADGRPAADRVARAVRWVGLLASLVAAAVYLPGVMVQPARLGAFRPLLGATALVLATWAFPRVPPVVARLRFPVLVALATALGAVVILASPSPGIDVWTMQEQGARALRAGRNPYTELYRNIYGPGTAHLDPALLTPDGRFIRAFPYTPLVLLLDAVSAGLGDVRWGMLAATAAAAILIRALGRGGRTAELAGALLLLQPQGFMVLELAWTEPVALATVLLAAWAVARTTGTGSRSGEVAGWRAWLVPGLAAALAASSKQYVPLVLLPLLVALPRHARVRALAVAVGGAAVVLVPFLAWDPAAFVRGVIEFQVIQPFRGDSLAWPAAIVSWGGPQLPSWPAFLVAGGALAVLLRRTATVAQAVLVGASAWLLLVLLNKQAFCNYYWLSVGLLCAAAALLLRPAPAAEGAPAPRR